MKTIGIAVVALLAAVPVYAGAVDQIAFFDAPVLSEAGVLALAVITGLVGLRLVGKYHGK